MKVARKLIYTLILVLYSILIKWPIGLAIGVVMSIVRIIAGIAKVLEDEVHNLDLPKQERKQK